MINEKINEKIIEFNNLLLELFFDYKYTIITIIFLAIVMYLSVPFILKIKSNLTKKHIYNNQLLNLKEINKHKFDIILDVRDKDEYNKKHVKNSINIDYKKILNNEEVLINIPKDKKILVLCNSGNRSSRVINKMVEDYGYKMENLFLTLHNIDELNTIL